MKYITFFREDDKFDDILSDPVIKKISDEKLTWYQHMMLGIRNDDESKISYITLKFGDEMVSNITPDFKPIPGVDYIMKKDPSLFPYKRK